MVWFRFYMYKFSFFKVASIKNCEIYEGTMSEVGGQKGNIQELTDQELEQQIKRRPRSPTLLNLNWLRERLKKVQVIKDRIASNNYEVDVPKTAKALISEE